MRYRKFQSPEVVEKGWLTIFSGPPMSGKTTESRRLAEDPNEKPFVPVEGHNGLKDLVQINALLDQGYDVIFETTTPVNYLSNRLLDLADTIQIFRRS